MRSREIPLGIHESHMRSREITAISLMLRINKCNSHFLHNEMATLKAKKAIQVIIDQFFIHSDKLPFAESWTCKSCDCPI